MSLETHEPTAAPRRFAGIPSVDRLLRGTAADGLVERHGREPVTRAVREELAALRAALAAGAADAIPGGEAILDAVARRLHREAQPPLRAVHNLTGTVLHTNLGRALLPQEAIDAMALVAGRAANLEYALEEGGRGDRDDHLEAQLRELTGAEAATVVNNNAAAVLLVLNTLAAGREVPTSRGELVEIGGSFRMPDVMRSAGCVLREVGTTNRTHLRDFIEAIGPQTGAVMKVHTSNYEVVGFTASADEAQLAQACRERGVPFVVDLGSGSLVDLRRWGLPHEPTPAEALAQGADLVTFSGDKLLGGPQAGIIAGRADLVARVRRNPLKRALRLDKMRIAALAAVLRLHADVERLPQRLPTLRALLRPAADIEAQARRVAPAVAAALAGRAQVEVLACDSLFGSGALPTRTLASAAVAIAPRDAAAAGSAVQALEAAFRRLPAPVIGRIQHGRLLLDLRCLDDEAGFVAQLPALASAREAA
jgi:L-seryl-tRNA(Ser) seleniumtransferase